MPYLSMKEPNFSDLKAVYVNCTLKKSPRISHTHGLAEIAMSIMKKEGVEVDYIRLADHIVPHGEKEDMTEYGEEKDEWPELFKRINDAEILVVATPIWLGELSSVAKKFIERLDAMSGKLNNKGQYIYYGKVGGCIVTGNEDGIKNCAKIILFSLQHIGYTIPPQADTGWIGKAGPGPSYLDEDSGGRDHEFTNKTSTFMSYNLMHLASYLKDKNGYPSYGNSEEKWDEGERWKFEKPVDYKAGKKDD